MNKDYELAMLTEAPAFKPEPVDMFVKYEFIALVKRDGDSVWGLAGQDNDCEITDVASYIQCMDHEGGFNYMCRSCLDNRTFLRTLKARGEARRCEQDPEDGSWSMEIAHEVGRSYPTGKANQIAASK
jgi:hypothetical protein